MAEATAADPRVAAAASHWGPRFVNNGVELGTFQATLGRIRRWEDWCREWSRSAEEFAGLARAAAAAGHERSAGEAWLRAGLCWHFGKFVFVDDMAQQREAHERAVEAYGRGLHLLEPPAERVQVPYQGTRLAALLRRPPGADAAPLVVIVPGLDSTKEEVQTTADHFLRRGAATLAIDGPGQGEAEYEFAIEPAYERVAAAVLDWMAGLPGVDASRVGLFGVSLGGYYALRCAAAEPRLRAVVALAGPYDFGDIWDTLPAQSRAAFQQRSGAGDPEEARARAGRLTLKGISAVACPTLVVHGRLDRIIPYAEAERAAGIPGVELRTYDTGNHGITNEAFASRSGMADWLADHLR